MKRRHIGKEDTFEETPRAETLELQLTHNSLITHLTTCATGYYFTFQMKRSQCDVIMIGRDDYEQNENKFDVDGNILENGTRRRVGMKKKVE